MLTVAAGDSSSQTLQFFPSPHPPAKTGILVILVNHQHCSLLDPALDPKHNGEGHVDRYPNHPSCKNLSTWALQIYSDS